jgi:hypothetical protein
MDVEDFLSSEIDVIITKENRFDECGLTWDSVIYLIDVYHLYENKILTDDK